jgi:uncharacterized protein YkwD
MEFRFNIKVIFLGVGIGFSAATLLADASLPIVPRHAVDDSNKNSKSTSADPSATNPTPKSPQTEVAKAISTCSTARPSPTTKDTHEESGLAPINHLNSENKTTPDPPQTENGGGAPSAVKQILDDINAHRRDIGAPPLTLNSKLTKAAVDHQEDMVANNISGLQSHTGSDGSNPWQRDANAGFKGKTSESVFLDGWAPDSIVSGLLQLSVDEGHRQDMEDPKFNSIGIGPAAPGSKEPIVIEYGTAGGISN